jgi:plasmid maintenance system killer protein
MSVEQQTNLAIKKMTLALDLSEKQQSQIAPLLKTQASKREAAMEKRKQFRAENKRPTADEIYAMRVNQLDNRIAFKNNMKDILTKEQFETFEKIAKNRGQKAKEKMKKGMKKRRMAKDRK